MSKMFNEESAMNTKRDKYLKNLVNRMHNGMNESLTGWKGAVKGFF